MAQLHFQPGQCANCDGSDVTVSAPLYCSPGCRQSAELVRYVRKHRRDGTDQDPDIVDVIRTRMAMVLGGGYPEQQRRVSVDKRTIVFDRAGGLCEECGRALDFDRSSGDPDAVATIQHGNGNSNDPSNLKAFCRRCNVLDAQSRFVPVEPGSTEAEYAAELRKRWMSENPLRLCYDDQQWNDIWRILATEAKEIVRMHEERAESAGDEDLPGFKGRTDQGTPIQEF